MGTPPPRDHSDTAAHIIRDTALRRVGIPVAGLFIPLATGAYAGLSWRDGWWWVGAAWFLLLS